MQPLHTMPRIGHSTTLTMPDFKGTQGDTLWREGGVRCVLVPAGAGTAVELDEPDSEYPDVVLTKPCLLPTLLAASRLLLSRVLPTAGSRPPAAPTA